jgi:hypothetical protein
MLHNQCTNLQIFKIKKNIDFMKTVRAEIKFGAKASRLELLIRIVWGLLAGLVLFVFAILAIVALFIQWFYILFLGKRHAGLHSWIKTFVVQRFLLTAYLNLLTDERPPIIPKMQKA